MLKTFYFGLLASCLVTLLFRFKRLPTYCLWFVPLIALAFATEWTKDVFKDYENIVQRIYQAIECLLLFMFYNQILKRKFNKTLVRILYVVYILIVAAYYGFYRNTFDVKDYFDYIIESLFICGFVSLFFLELLNYRGSMKLWMFAAFWINAVNLIFYGGNFFAMGLYQKINNSDSPLSKEIIKIPFYLNLFLYAAYLVIFMLARKKQSHAH